jgi:WD40-like Beta Propeller Repeat
MYSHDNRKLIGGVNALRGVAHPQILQGPMKGLRGSRRQVLKAALATGAVGTVMGPAMVLSRSNRQLGPFSDWSEPVNLGPIVNSRFNDFHPGISRDELSLYITSDRPGGVNGDNPNAIPEIWVSQREDRDAPWEPPINLGSSINVPGYDSSVPNLTPNGQWLFLNSNRPDGYGQGDLWVARREDPEDEDDLAWEAPVNLGGKINTSSDEASPVYFRDREREITTLYFNRFDGPGGDFLNPDQDYNIYVSTLGEDGTFGPGVLVRELYSPFRDTRMAIRSDGLEMIFTSNRPGGIGPARLNLNLWVSTRASTDDPWSTPTNLWRPINYGGGYRDRGPVLSFDGKTLYFASDRPGSLVPGKKFDLWVATRTKLGEDESEDQSRLRRG